ncbi:MAG: zinc ribbon domain-containing protein [Vicinamibacterales bacterium]
MPLYEYACRDCGKAFEFLTRAGQEPACPACASRSLDKRSSVFAVNTSTAATAVGPAPCGMCGDPRGPGACSMN